MKKTSLVIWDFNGTLLDDTGISIEAINTVLSRRGLKTVRSKEDFQNIFTFPVEEYYRRLGFDFEKEPFTVPADEWVKLYDEKKFFSPAVEGAPETVKKLSGMGVRQIVLSACEKNLLRSQLEKIGILACFDDELVLQGETKRLQVTIGQFSITRMQRSTQLLIPAFDYPTKSCTPSAVDAAQSPCELFSQIDFPMDAFFPGKNDTCIPPSENCTSCSRTSSK